MRRTPAEIYAAARGAGLNSAQAVIATAVALAESNGDDAALGDIALQNGTWGPSAGAWQVRTLKADTGKGTNRDVSALTAGGLGRQAQAMAAISAGGTNWSPWSVYGSGAYQRYLGQAQAAAVGDPGATQLLSNPTAAGGGAATQVVDQARGILLKLVAGVLGLALLGVGLNTALSLRKRTIAGGDKVRSGVAQAAVAL